MDAVGSTPTTTLPAPTSQLLDSTLCQENTLSRVCLGPFWTVAVVVSKFLQDGFPWVFNFPLRLIDTGSIGSVLGAIWMKCMGKRRGLRMTEAAETVWQGSGNEEVTSMDSTRIRLYQHNNLDNLRMRTVQEWDAGEDE